MAVMVTAAGLSAGDTINFDGEPALIQGLIHERTPHGDGVYSLKLKILRSNVTTGRSYRAGDKVELVPLETKPVTLASSIEEISLFVDSDGLLYELRCEDIQPAFKYLYEGTPETFSLSLYNGEPVTIRPSSRS